MFLAQLKEGIQLLKVHVDRNVFTKPLTNLYQQNLTLRLPHRHSSGYEGPSAKACVPIIPIDRGAFGTVWKTVEAGPGKVCAMKRMIHCNNIQGVREVRTLEVIGHIKPPIKSARARLLACLLAMRIRRSRRLPLDMCADYVNKSTRRGSVLMMCASTKGVSHIMVFFNALELPSPGLVIEWCGTHTEVSE